MGARHAAWLVIACLAVLLSLCEGGRISDIYISCFRSGRRLQSWIGGPGTSSIIAANDAVAAIRRAASSDDFSSSYAATQEGYRDADATVYPDDINADMWLTSPYRYESNNFYPDGTRRLPGGTTPESELVSSEVNG